MKRYEKYTKEEIIKIMSRVDHDCIVNPKECPHLGKDSLVECSDCWANYLKQEIKMKPRWATIKSNEDLDNLWNEFVDFQDCNSAFGYDDFIHWLKDEVEV